MLREEEQKISPSKHAALAIMQEYNITDAASCAAAVQLLNTKFYSLRSKSKENQDLSTALGSRIDSYEKRKKFQKYYRTWERLPKAKQGGFERKYEYELRQYRQADGHSTHLTHVHHASLHHDRSFPFGVPLSYSASSILSMDKMYL